MPDDRATQKNSDRLKLSRIRILHDYGFYGLLLTHFDFVFSEDCPNVATDGRRMYFNPQFLQSLSDEELDIVMMHELLHVVLRHNLREKQFVNERFDVACDIVVNSCIMRDRNQIEPLILKNHGVLLHKAPDGKDGHLYSVDEIYEMLPRRRGKPGRIIPAFADEHSLWGVHKQEDAGGPDEWDMHILDAAGAMSVISVRNGVKARGEIPLLAQRYINRITAPQVDWRTVLNDFIQEEVYDYTFAPPDRRFADSSFLLPDFSDREEKVKDILFMIDASGSMSDDEVAAAFSEIYGAISQFGGKLTGYLSFFDTAVTPHVPVESVEQLLKVMPKGNGGTDFEAIFNYVDKKMAHIPPVSIIVLTDGYAPFPDRRRANGIPVLWLLNNEDVTPPWGKVARMLGRRNAG